LSPAYRSLAQDHWQRRMRPSAWRVVSERGRDRQPERATQNRVIALFRDELGFRNLGDWIDRPGNSNIEEGLLSGWLTKRGYNQAQIAVTLHKLRIEANDHNRDLYHNNQAVYGLLRYGVNVLTEAGQLTETIPL